MISDPKNKKSLVQHSLQPQLIVSGYYIRFCGYNKLCGIWHKKIFLWAGKTGKFLKTKRGAVENETKIRILGNGKFVQVWFR
jgi:hypothetical protein